MKVGDMVVLKSQYDNTDMFESFGTTVTVGTLERGTLCLVLEMQSSLMAKILTPSGRVGWLPIGWLTSSGENEAV